MDEHEHEKRDNEKDDAPEVNEPQQVTKDAGKKVKQPRKAVTFIADKESEIALSERGESDLSTPSTN